VVDGVIRGDEREAKPVVARLQRVVEVDGDETYVDFQQVEARSIVSTPLINVDMSVNGQQSYTAHLGDTLTYTIAFRNDSTFDLAGAKLTAKLEGSMFETATVNTSGFFDSRTNTITWDASSVPALANLRANQSGQVTFGVGLRDNFTGGSLGTQNSVVRTVATMDASNLANALGIDQVEATDELITRISTAPSFQQVVTRGDSQFGSLGPFPPVVDEATTYTVKWALINPANKLSPVTVTATLAPGVEWTGSVRVNGAFVVPSYNSVKRQVTWSLSNVQGGTGVDTPYEVYFQVSATPSVNQIGDELQLLNGTSFNATDSFTGETISSSIQDTSSRDVVDGGNEKDVQSAQ